MTIITDCWDRLKKFCAWLWKICVDFHGRLSCRHTAFFLILLLVLAGVNIYANVYSWQRYKDSAENPISVMRVVRLRDPPPFTVAVRRFAKSNITLSCTQKWNSDTACPHDEWSHPLDGKPVMLIAGTATDEPFALGDSYFVMRLFASDVQQGDCAFLQLLGVPLATITAAKFDDISSAAPLSSHFLFCPQPVADNSFFQQQTSLSFSALEYTSGRVAYSVSVGGGDSGSPAEGDEPPRLDLTINLKNGLPVDWEKQEPDFTWQNALSMVFSVFNISLTALLCCFPWKYVDRQQNRHGRRFVFEGDAVADHHDPDFDRDLVPWWQTVGRIRRVTLLSIKVMRKGFSRPQQQMTNADLSLVQKLISCEISVHTLHRLSRALSRHATLLFLRRKGHMLCAPAAHATSGS